jgi:hypothetical protein
MLRSAGARRLRKTLERCPAGAKKNSPENFLLDLGRDSRTSTQSRRLVRRKGASWSLDWPSGACATRVHSLCASVTAVYLPFFAIGRVLSRLD